MRELEDIFQSLKQKFAELDKDAARNKKLDYTLLPQNELDHILKSEIKPMEKKKLLLTQMGYLRINLFIEYAERIRLAEDNKDLDKAVKLMNEYAETIAIPFMSLTKKPSLTGRFMDLFSRERVLKPSEYIQKWKSDYQSWLNQNKSLHTQIYERERFERFLQLQMTFHMLYNLSWSIDNFPPAPIIIYYDPTKIKL